MRAIEANRAKWWMTLAAAAYALFCISIVVGTTRPEYNWDMLAYVAETLASRPGATAASAHHDTFAVVRAHVSDEHWRLLTEGNDYRSEQARNPDAFMSMLGMYRIKLGYRVLLRTVSHVFDPVVAAVVVSMLAGAALAGLIGFWLLRAGHPELMVLAIPILILADLPLMTRLQTPDMVATLFLVAGTICVLASRDWLACALIVLAIAIRPDNLIFAGLLPAAFLLARKMPVPYIAGLAAALAIYALAVSTAGYPGWWRHFLFTFSGAQPTLDDWNPPFVVSVYAIDVVKSAGRTLSWRAWPWLAAAAVFVLLYFRPLREQLRGRILVLLAALGTSLLLKFAIFPIEDDRIYAAYVISLWLVVADAFLRAQGEASAAGPAEHLTAWPQART